MTPRNRLLPGWLERRLPHAMARTPGTLLVLVLGAVLVVFLNWSLIRDREAGLNAAHATLTRETVTLADLLGDATSDAGALAQTLAAELTVPEAGALTARANRIDGRLPGLIKDIHGLAAIVIHDRRGQTLAEARRHDGIAYTAPDRDSWGSRDAQTFVHALTPGTPILGVSRAILDRASKRVGSISVYLDIADILPETLSPQVTTEVRVHDIPLMIRGPEAGGDAGAGGVPDPSTALSSHSRVDTGGDIVLTLSLPRHEALAGWTNRLVVSVSVSAAFILLLGGVVLSILRDTTHNLALERQRERDSVLMADAMDASGLGTWDWDTRTQTGLMKGGDLPPHMPVIPDWLEKVVPEDRGALRAALDARTRSLDSALDMQARIDLGEGWIRWVRFRGRRASVHLGDAEITRVTGLWADVSDQNTVAMERLRLATAVERGPVAVMMTDAEGRIDYVNRKFQDMMGYQAEDVLNQRPSMMGSGLTEPSVYSDLWANLSRGRDWSGEIINRHKDGHLVWHHVSISPIRAEDKVIGHVSVHEDISERKRLQENLTMQMGMMRAVLDISPNGILVADLHGRARMINLRLRRLWDLDLETATSEEPGLLFETMARKVVAPDQFLTTIQALNETPREPEVGLEITFTDGRVIERHSLAVEDDTGTPWGRVWFFREVTEQKRVERALSDQLEFQHTLLNTLPNPVFHMDRQERFLGCNRAFATLVGRSPEAVFGAAADELFTHERARRLTEGNGELLREGGTDNREITLMDTEGVFRDMAMSKAAFTDAQGRVSGLVGILTDVSNLKKATDELRRSNQELEQFAYVASHDLQEPLRMVSSYLGLLKRRYADHLDADAEEFIGYAVDGAHRMQDLIQDLLHFSRIDTRGNPLEPTSTRLCLDMALNNLRVSLEEADAQLSIAALPLVMADDAQLTSLFQNILGNAVKYRSPERRPEISVSAEKDGDYWCFAVSDNGIGIAPQYADKVFMIFQRLQTRDRYPGTGIGLAVVKKIVERHGGRIWLDGEEGVGTTFYFTLRGIPEEFGSFTETAE